MSHSVVTDVIKEVHTYDSLKIALATMYPSVKLENITLAKNLSEVAFDVVSTAVNNGWINSLIVSLKNEFPLNPTITSLQFESPKHNPQMYVDDQKIDKDLIELRVRLFGVNGKGGFFDVYEEHQIKLENTLELLNKRVAQNEARLNKLENLNQTTQKIIQSIWLKMLLGILFFGAVASLVLVGTQTWN